MKFAHAHNTVREIIVKFAHAQVVLREAVRGREAAVGRVRGLDVARLEPHAAYAVRRPRRRERGENQHGVRHARGHPGKTKVSAENRSFSHFRDNNEVHQENFVRIIKSQSTNHPIDSKHDLLFEFSPLPAPRDGACVFARRPYEDQEMVTLRGHGGAVYGSTFLPDARFLLSSSADTSGTLGTQGYTLGMWAQGTHLRCGVLRVHTSSVGY